MFHIARLACTSKMWEVLGLISRHNDTCQAVCRTVWVFNAGSYDCRWFAMDEGVDQNHKNSYRFKSSVVAINWPSGHGRWLHFGLCKCFKEESEHHGVDEQSWTGSILTSRRTFNNAGSVCQGYPVVSLIAVLMAT